MKGKSFCSLVFYFLTLLTLISTIPYSSAAQTSKQVDNFERYADENKKYNDELLKMKGDEEKLKSSEKEYARLIELNKSGHEDYLLMTYAGLVGMRRCAFTNNVTLQSQFSGESLPLLDKAVRKAEFAFKADNSLAHHMVLVLKNRAEIFVNLPKFFRKEKIAVSDVEKAIKYAETAKSPEDKVLELKLLQVRALANAGEIKDAKESFVQVQKIIKAKKLEASLQEFIEDAAKKLKSAE